MEKAFLSIDVAGSTIIKHGTTAERISITFSNYHSYVSQIINKNEGTVVVISGDGVMAHFPTADNAVAAAFKIQSGMGKFNRAQNKLPFPLRLRIGISFGVIGKLKITGKDTHMLLDAAGTVQKDGVPGNVNISYDTFYNLKKYKKDFTYYKTSEVLKTTLYVNKPRPHWGPELVGKADAVHYTKGYDFLNQMRYSEAEKEFKRALKEAGKTKDLKWISSCLHGLCYSLGRQRKNKEKIPLTLRHIETERKIGDRKTLVISLRNLFYAYKWLSRDLEREQKFTEALCYLEKALSVANEIDDEYLIKDVSIDMNDLKSYLTSKRI